ncbi:hypothetical protein I4U23_022245 [Adineta vaga]|nr:hypothetical protein I4U23_022245 [Adineta vaga]
MTFSEGGVPLINLNLFSTNDEPVIDQRLGTRLYIVLVGIGVVVVLLFSGFSTQTNTITIHGNPVPLSIIEQLQSRFPTTLSCPCTQTSIRRDKFLSFMPEYHPVCSSTLVQPEWIESLFRTYNRTRYYHPLDFRLIASSQFEFIALLCRTASSAINDTLYGEFGSTLMISAQLSTHVAFEIETSAIVEQFLVNTAATLLRTHRLLFKMLEQNSIVSALRTNYFTTMVPGSADFITYWTIYPMDFTTNETDPFNTLVPYCECVWTFDCTFPAGIYNEEPRNGLGGLYLPQPPPLSLVSGMLTGCIPSSSILQSNLQCFYDRACVSTLGERFNETILLTRSRFLPNTTIEVLLTELLLESLHNASSYVNYFMECAPTMCTYLYSRRFDVLHMFTTVTSIFGGLSVIFRVLSPIIIKFYRRFTRVRTENEHQEEEEEEEVEENRLQISMRILQIFHLAKEKILTFDLFESDEIRLGIISTRVYISLLLIGAVTFSTYTSLATDMYTVMIRSPSFAQYENLEKLYSSTLVCGCSRLSISYNQIIDIQPRYHQVCLSEFVTDIWLSYFDLGSYARLLTWFPNDFRLSGQIFFSLLQVLCDMADETVSIAIADFNSTDLITMNILSHTDFNVQTATILNQFEIQTIALFMRYSALFAQQNNQTVYFSPIIDEKNCSCGTSSQCGGLRGFYPIWRMGMGFGSDNIIQPVTGFAGGCFPIEAGLLSSLECIYNQSCLTLIIAWRSFNLTDIIIKPLEFATSNISALNPNLKSRFMPNTTIDMLASQLFIEEWITMSKYEEYYKQCAPSECTYTDDGGFNVLHIIASLLGIWTGLTLCLRLAVPLGVTLIHRYFCIRPSEQGVVVETPYRRKFMKIWSTLWSINVFSKVKTMTIAMQRAATRIYFLFLTGCLICIFLLLSFRQQTYTKIVSTPTASTVNTLYQQPTLFSLKCPCSQNSISYNMFLSISPIQHIICSSAFVSTQWWERVFDNQTDSDQSHETSLIDVANKLISFEVMSQNVFNARINTLINTFLKQAPIDFHHTLAFVTGNLKANQFMNMPTSNWQIALSNAEEQYLINTIPRTFSTGNNSSSCSCDSSSTCSKPFVFTMNRSYPGLFRGCLPIDGLRLSTLECFSKTDCLIQLLSDLLINGTQFNIVPLNSSTITNITLPIGDMIDELFVEEWETASNYSSYFSICAPLSCEYSSIQRNNALDIVSTLFGVYGGLTIVLRFLAPLVIKLYEKIRARRIAPDL